MRRYERDPSALVRTRGTHSSFFLHPQKNSFSIFCSSTLGPTLHMHVARLYV